MSELDPNPAEAPPRGRMRGLMDRFIDTIELIAAIFVGIVAANIFIAVLLRNLCSTAIPDSYNIGQYLLGILIFWGIAATSYRGTHITVDLVWANTGPGIKRGIDVFATLVLLFVVTVQTYTLFDKVATTRIDNVLTFELHLPVWPFFAVAWAGDVSAVLLIATRTYRLMLHPDDISPGPIPVTTARPTSPSRSSDRMPARRDSLRRPEAPGEAGPRRMTGRGSP